METDLTLKRETSRVAMATVAMVIDGFALVDLIWFSAVRLVCWVHCSG